MPKPLIGILGGMGPLASAGFVNSLYQKCQAKFAQEQCYPRVVLLSDPSIPDRMASATDKNLHEELILALESNIKKLLAAGSESIVIGCFTAHYFLSKLSLESRSRLINLVTLLDNTIDAWGERTLIFCSEFLALSGLINSRYAVYPEKEYFARIHQLIYQIKLNGPNEYRLDIVKLTQRLSRLYGVSRVILACTEFHLIYQQGCPSQWQSEAVPILDGLDIAVDFILAENRSLA